LVDDHHCFQVDSGRSGATQLRTLGFVQPDGRAMLRLLLACAPLPNVVINDASIGGTAMRSSGTAVVVL
jgi:hypothetical protein